MMYFEFTARYWSENVFCLHLRKVCYIGYFQKGRLWCVDWLLQSRLGKCTYINYELLMFCSCSIIHAHKNTTGREGAVYISLWFCRIDVFYSILNMHDMPLNSSYVLAPQRSHDRLSTWIIFQKCSFILYIESLVKLK